MDFQFGTFNQFFIHGLINFGVGIFFGKMVNYFITIVQQYYKLNTVTTLVLQIMLALIVLYLIRRYIVKSDIAILILPPVYLGSQTNLFYNIRELY